MTRPSFSDYGTYDESAYPELWDGVSGAWAPCLGPTGSRLHDHSRRANWGTLINMNNATDWVVSDGQYALDFDGVNDGDYVEALPLDLIGPFTISFWIKSGDINQTSKYIFSRMTGVDNDYSIIYGYVSQSLEFYSGRFSGTNPRTNSAIAIPDTNWHHIAYSYRPGEWSGYRDGVRVFSNAATFTLTMSAGAGFYFAAFRPLSSRLLGALDDIKFRSRGLNANQIATEYRLGRGGMYQRRRRTARRAAIEQAGFRAYWARRQNQIIGGGV